MSKKEILVIDDNVDTLMMLEYLLENAGFSTRTAWDGQEGLKLFQKNRFDLVVLDISMPRMSGVDVLKEIRRRDTNIPVIIMTGTNYNAALQQECQSLGVKAFISKPKVERLLEEVKSLLGAATSLSA